MEKGKIIILILKSYNKLVKTRNLVNFLSLKLKTIQESFSQPFLIQFEMRFEWHFYKIKKKKKAQNALFLPVFHNFLYLNCIFHEFSRVQDQFVSISFWEYAQSTCLPHFSKLFASKSCKNVWKACKRRFWPAFGVCSTQTMVKIYKNLSRLKSFFCHSMNGI